MNQELTPQEKAILERYAARVKARGKTPPTLPKPSPARTTAPFSIEALVNDCREFYSEEKDGKGNHIGVAVALQEAYDQMGSEGIIASMPYHIAGKAHADKSNYLWQKWFTTHSEENAGIDKNGRLVNTGQPIVLTVHGKGILTPERIRQAYTKGLTPQNAAKLTEQEFNDLLEGKLPSGENIELYTLDDVKKGSIPDPFGRYAVWMDFETAKDTKSGYHQKKEFLENPLVIARAGTLEYLEEYYEKAKFSDGDLGNHHPFGDIDPKQAQGRLLFLYGSDDGLSGYGYLCGSGRFVGVAPEARRARK